MCLYLIWKYGVDQIVEHVKNVNIINSNIAVGIISPLDVDKLMVSDAESLEVYFVAIARSAGIPARIDIKSGKSQYWDGKKWNYSNIAADKESGKTGMLTLDYKKMESIDNPRYAAASR